MCNVFYLALVLISVSVSGFPSVIKNSNEAFTYEHNENGSFSLCSRECWLAMPSTDTRALNTPVPYVIIHHTAVPVACNTSEQCIRSMQSMQKYHNSLTWGDIGYNFCVGSEGVAYEGRGWNVIGIHTGNANSRSIGICLIGDWRVDLPPAKQLATTKSLIARGIQLGYISPDYKLIGHNQVIATECPGGALFAHISTWKHFQPGHINFNNNIKNKNV